MAEQHDGARHVGTPTLRMLHAGSGGAEIRQRMDGLASTLCVSTGIRLDRDSDCGRRPDRRRHRLPGARVEVDTPLTAGAGAPAV
ncbi:DUF5133 domain-containing protein [Streptomyces hygroscopicus]|uniref:DUF5133 domain-containing protein n=1 Tax=Streptomyces hygroscopicus TaxID=1912 RepID=UPI00368D6D88